MVLVAVIVWVGRRGGVLRLCARLRGADVPAGARGQATIQGRIAVLEGEGLGTLGERTAELSEKVAKMQAALERLEHSLAGSTC